MKPADYQAALDAELLRREDVVLALMEPVIAQAVDELTQVIASLPAGQLTAELELEALLEQDIEELVGRVNDRLRDVLGAALAEATPAVRALAAGHLEGSRVAFPQLTAEQLLAAVVMEGQALAAWFRRASPSPWMRSLMRRAENVIREGWARDEAAKAFARDAAAAFGETVRSTIASTVRTALWTHADTQQQLVWDAAQAGKWRYYTREDELVCVICAPWHLKEAPTRRELPSLPRHINCRCQVIPVP